MTALAIGSWDDVEQLLAEGGGGAVLRVPRGWLPHPLVHGMRPTVGLPRGQASDFVKTCTAGRLRVERHARHDLAWIEPGTAAPALDDDGGRLRELARGVALGALLGAALGRSPAAVLAGAAAGGVLTAALSQRES